MWLFRSLPQAYTLDGLRGVPSAPTSLATVTKDKQYVLNFAPVYVGGATTALVDDLLADVQATPIVNVTRVCNAYLYTVDQYLWPSSTYTLASVPDPLPGCVYDAAQNATQPLPPPDTVFTQAVRDSMPVPYAGRAGRIVGAVVGSIAGVAALAAAAAFAWRASLHRAARTAEAAGRVKGLEEGLAEVSSRLESGGSKHNPGGRANGSTLPGGSSRTDGTAMDGAALASLLTATLSRYASVSGVPGSLAGAGAADPELAAALGSTDWQLDPARVSILADEAGTPVVLGEGGFGAVYLAELDGATRVAVKLVGSQAPREAARFAREVALLKSLRHPNIVQFQGAYLAGDRIALVLEYAARGDLHRALGRDFGREYGWPKRGRAVALDVSRAIVYMHSRTPPVVHLDLKPANVLLDRAHSAKVSDVGLSKVLSRADTQVSMEGTFDWAAPELLAGERVSEKADIYSYGVILWELCTGEPPRNRQMRPVRVPDECPADVAALIDACRARDPAQRPTAKDVYERLRATPGPAAAAAAARVSASTPVGTPSSPSALAPASSSVLAGGSARTGSARPPLPSSFSAAAGARGRPIAAAAAARRRRAAVRSVRRRPPGRRLRPGGRHVRPGPHRVGVHRRVGVGGWGGHDAPGVCVWWWWRPRVGAARRGLQWRHRARAHPAVHAHAGRHQAAPVRVFGGLREREREREYGGVACVFSTPPERRKNRCVRPQTVRAPPRFWLRLPPLSLL